MGYLKIEIDKTADIQTTAVTLGSVAAGGRYGENYILTEDGQSALIALPPGEHKTVFLNFDLAKSRWPVTIRPQQTTTMRFKAISQTQLEK